MVTIEVRKHEDQFSVAMNILVDKESTYQLGGDLFSIVTEPDEIWITLTYIHMPNEATAKEFALQLERVVRQRGHVEEQPATIIRSQGNA